MHQENELKGNESRFVNITNQTLIKEKLDSLEEYMKAYGFSYELDTVNASMFTWLSKNQSIETWLASSQDLRYLNPHNITYVWPENLRYYDVRFDSREDYRKYPNRDHNFTVYRNYSDL